MSDEDNNSDPDDNKEQSIINPEKSAAVLSKPMVFNRRQGDRDYPKSSLWLVTFTDIMALMLTFFVMMLSMSNPDAQKWEKMLHDVQENIGRFSGAAANRGGQDSFNIERVNYSRALNLGYLQQIIDNLIEKDKTLHNIIVIPNDNSLIISLPQDLMFETGKADVTEVGNAALYLLAGTLSRIKNRLEVVGHTDPRPVTGGEFASNWELSLTRAANVAAVLEAVGYDRSITLRGYASGRYQDMAAEKDITEEDRLRLSRRVDIVIMEDDGRQFHLFDTAMPKG